MFWKVRAMPRAAMPCAGTFSSDWPSNRVAFGRAVETRHAVEHRDLPAPFGPISAWIAPCATSIEKRLSARNPPKRTPTSRSENRGALMSALRPAMNPQMPRGMNITAKMRISP